MGDEQMGTFTIQDTGQLTLSHINNSTTDELDIVNSGNVITLYNTSVTFDQSVNVDSNSEILKFREVSGDTSLQRQKRQFEIPVVEPMSITAPAVKVDGAIDLSKTSADEMGAELIGTLNRLAKTKGLKKIYCDEIIKYLNYEEEGIIDGVYARVKSVRFIKNSASENLLNFTITFLLSS